MSLAQNIAIFNRVRFGCLLTGIAGNLISFVVFSRKSFRHNSINIYCRALAFFDSLVILLQLVNDTSNIFFGTNLYITSDAICKFSVYAAAFLPPNSSWILVAFAFDKLLCVRFPHRYSFFKLLQNF